MKFSSLKNSAWMLAIGALIIISGLYFLPDVQLRQSRHRQGYPGTNPAFGTATGTVNPVITVQVGSYVSGPIQAIYADFNSPVKQGQLIAKIDPRPFKVKVDAAKAVLANARAQYGKDSADLAYKKINYQRNAELLKDGAISKDAADLAFSTTIRPSPRSDLTPPIFSSSRQISKTRRFSSTTAISSRPSTARSFRATSTSARPWPRAFQTPTLFLIAKDLTKMQVDSNVSESDIGNVMPGMGAEFKVDTFPDREFEGTVRQVRQAPITVQNVVTYDVVVNVDNPELLLKPGMTANVTIVTAHRDNVLPNPDGRAPLRARRHSTRAGQCARRRDLAATRPRVGADAWRRDTASLGHDWPRRRQQCRTYR